MRFMLKPRSCLGSRWRPGSRRVLTWRPRAVERCEIPQTGRVPGMHRATFKCQSHTLERHRVVLVPWCGRVSCGFSALTCRLCWGLMLMRDLLAVALGLSLPLRPEEKEINPVACWRALTAKSFTVNALPHSRGDHSARYYVRFDESLRSSTEGFRTLPPSRGNHRACNDFRVEVLRDSILRVFRTSIHSGCMCW